LTKKAIGHNAVKIGQPVKVVKQKYMERRLENESGDGPRLQVVSEINGKPLASLVVIKHLRQLDRRKRGQSWS
jgi:hypothetical protein